jgi:hypothetical protein
MIFDLLRHGQPVYSLSANPEGPDHLSLMLSLLLSLSSYISLFLCFALSRRESLGRRIARWARYTLVS